MIEFWWIGVSWLVWALILVSYRILMARKNRPGVISTETYGYPVSPMQVVYDLLPAPPGGHAWELEAGPAFCKSDGTAPTLRMMLSLVDLVDDGKDRVVDYEGLDLLYTAEGESWLAIISGERRPERYVRETIFEPHFLPAIDRMVTKAQTKALLAQPSEFMIKY